MHSRLLMLWVGFTYQSNRGTLHMCSRHEWFCLECVSFVLCVSSFTTVSRFNQSNTKFPSEKWNSCSFGQKLIHFVTTCSWPPIKKLFLHKFLHLINWIKKCPQKNWNGCSFGHKSSHFVTTCSWPPIKKIVLQKFLHWINWIWKWPQMYLIYKLLSEVLHLRIYVRFSYLLLLFQV